MQIKKPLKKLGYLTCIAGILLGLSACSSRQQANQNTHVSETAHVGRTQKTKKNTFYTPQQYQRLIQALKDNADDYQKLNKIYRKTYRKIKEHPKAYAPRIKLEFKISKRTNRQVASGSKPSTYFNRQSKVSHLYQRIKYRHKLINKLSNDGKPKGHLREINEINRYSDKYSTQASQVKRLSIRFTKLCIKVNHQYNN